MRRLRTALPIAVLVGLLGAGLAGCGSSDSHSGTTPTPTTSASASGATDYLPVPAGTALTAEGTTLHLGQAATLAVRPAGRPVGVLRITVTQVERTTLEQSFVGWNLDKGFRKATPYFVHALVTNRGNSQLGGHLVPLYIVDGKNTLVRPTTFSSRFTACPGARLPAKFGPGTSAQVCLVYLSPHHGGLDAVSFRPHPSFDPITWTGTVKTLHPPEIGRHRGASSRGPAKKSRS